MRNGLKSSLVDTLKDQLLNHPNRGLFTLPPSIPECKAGIPGFLRGRFHVSDLDFCLSRDAEVKKNPHQRSFAMQKRY